MAESEVKPSCWEWPCQLSILGASTGVKHAGIGKQHGGQGQVWSALVWMQDEAWGSQGMTRRVDITRENVVVSTMIPGGSDFRARM